MNAADFLTIVSTAFSSWKKREQLSTVAGEPAVHRAAHSAAPLREKENSSVNKHSWRKVKIQHRLRVWKKEDCFCCCYFGTHCYSVWHCLNTDSFLPAFGFSFSCLIFPQAKWKESICKDMGGKKSCFFKNSASIKNFCFTQ